MTTSDRAGLIVATRSIALIALCAMLVPSRLFAQASVYYVYDDLNRLVAVVDQQGNAATYTYDAIGNILRIDRFDASGQPDGVAISMFTPSAGAIGTTVQVFGRGFADGIAQNSLFFGAQAATLTVCAVTSSGNAGRIVTIAEALSVASSSCVAVIVTTGGTGITAGAV